MKYILELAMGFAFASGALAQNADLRNKDLAASHHQETATPSTNRATLSTSDGHGGARSGNLDRQLAKIEHQTVKSGGGKPMHHASPHVPKPAEQDAGNTKPINSGPQHQKATRKRSSNNRARK
jgi:hypothetical protein